MSVMVLLTVEDQPAAPVLRNTVALGLGTVRFDEEMVFTERL